MPPSSSHYPLYVEDQRTLPDGYEGPVFVWDIDKTYLSTHFSSLRGLGRIPLEFAVDKEAIPGMPELLRGIRRGPGKRYRCVPLYFVTASPPRLRGVLADKMLLDGVEYDGITFKDWWGLLRRGRPGRILDQVGFKLCALLEGRRTRPLATEFLFGDDVEGDAEAFSLYAALLHDEISAGEAVERMTRAGVREENRRAAFSLLDRLPLKRGRVKRFFIHLERRTPPERFDRFGPLATPVRNALQLALALYALGQIDRQTVYRCRDALLSSPAGRRLDLAGLTADAVDRGLITAAKARGIRLQPTGATNGSRRGRS